MLAIIKQAIHSKVFLAITVAIVIAIAMTALSVYMYISSGVSRLDLSLPMYEQVRDEVKPKGLVKDFESSGPINQEVINEFMKLYESQQEQLRTNNGFNNVNLEDEALRLNPESIDF